MKENFYLQWIPSRVLKFYFDCYQLCIQIILVHNMNVYNSIFIEMATLSYYMYLKCKENIHKSQTLVYSLTYIKIIIVHWSTRFKQSDSTNYQARTHRNDF